MFVATTSKNVCVWRFSIWISLPKVGQEGSCNVPQEMPTFAGGNELCPWPFGGLGASVRLRGFPAMASGKGLSLISVISVMPEAL